MNPSDESSYVAPPLSSRPAGSRLTAALDTPWRVTNEVRRLAALPYIRVLFAVYGVPWGRGWRIFGMPIIQRHRGSRITLGDHLQLRSWYTANPLAPNHPVVLATRRPDAIIQVGQHCGFTGSAIVAAQSVMIGDRVLVGANASIVDTDFHPLDPLLRQQDILAGSSRPIVIEDDVFIGMSAIVLKGVTIGHGSVVGAGSVVSRDIPPRSIVAGNPASVIGEL